MADIDPTKVKQSAPRLELSGVAQKSLKEILDLHPQLFPDLLPRSWSMSEQRLVIDDRWLEDLQKTLRSSAPESRASSSPVTNKY